MKIDHQRIKKERKKKKNKKQLFFIISEPTLKDLQTGRDDEC